MQCTLNRQSKEHKIWSHNTHIKQMNGENETKVHLFDTRIVVQYKSALVLQSQTAVTELGRKKKNMYTVKQIK